jgi:hypothetical protein
MQMVSWTANQWDVESIAHPSAELDPVERQVNELSNGEHWNW